MIDAKLVVIFNMDYLIFNQTFRFSFSLCKQFDLDSGIPLNITLLSGDCPHKMLDNETSTEPITEDFTEASSTEMLNILNLGKHSAIKNMTRDAEVPVIVKNTTEIIELGKHVIIQNKTRGSLSPGLRTPTKVPESTTSKITNQFPTTEPWKPITRHMILEIINGKVSLNQTKIDEEKFLNYGERIPKKTKTEKRSFENYKLESSLVDNTIPTGQSSTTPSSSGPEPEKEKVKENEEVEKLITVQLFPAKLADVFERAEKYARFTLFPLISDTFMNFFNGRSNTGNSTNIERPIILERVSKDRNYKTSEEIDDKIIQSFKFLQKSTNSLEEVPKPIEKVIRKNSSDITDLSIHIDLPTYAPETQQQQDKPKFIPISNNNHN